MNKLKVEEAFNHFKALWPWLKKIVKVDGSNGSYKSYHIRLYDAKGERLRFGSVERPDIDWGTNDNHYQPESWRPITINDIGHYITGTNKFVFRLLNWGGLNEHYRSDDKDVPVNIYGIIKGRVCLAFGREEDTNSLTTTELEKVEVLES
jgi:hypothetical protein